MEQWRHALRLAYRILAAGGTYDYVKSERVPVGQQWHITSHSFENETGARGTARGYIDGHGYEHWLWEQTTPLAATLYWSEEDITLTEGEQLCVRQASCTASDKLRLLINGHIVYQNKET